MFKPVKSRKLYLEIVTQVKALIEQEKLKPGDKLPSELELTKQFNASRSSIREALAALEISGIVEGRRGNGNYICEGIDNLRFSATVQELADRISPFELLEVRKAVETGIVALAAEKANEEHLIRLEKILSEMPDAIETKKWNNINAQFHLCIAESTENPLLIDIMKNIVESMEYIHWKSMEVNSSFIPGRLEQFYQEHINLVKYMKEKNIDMAVETMKRHLEEREHDFLKP